MTRVPITFPTPFYFFTSCLLLKSSFFNSCFWCVLSSCLLLHMNMHFKFLKRLLCFTFWCQPLRCFRKRGIFSFLVFLNWLLICSIPVLTNRHISWTNNPTCSPCAHCMCSNLWKYFGQFDCVSFLHFSSLLKSTPCSTKGEVSWCKVFLEQCNLDFLKNPVLCWYS